MESQDLRKKVHQIIHPASCLLLVLVTVLASCDTGSEVQPASDDAWFPLRTGMYRTYDVTTNSYSELNGKVSESYQLQVTVVDSFLTAGNTWTYVLQRATRSDESDPWVISSVWSVRRDGDRIIVNEETTPYVKLMFPVVEGQSWNGNAFNTLGNETYHIDQTGVSFLEFTNCIHVTEAAEDNLVYTDERSTLYAKDIGPVYVNRTQLNYCTDPDCLGQKVIADGVEYVQTLTDYGN